MIRMSRLHSGIGVLTRCSVVFWSIFTSAEATQAAEVPAPVLERTATIALKGPVGGLDHLTIDSKRERLFVANTSNGTVDVVDLKTRSLIKQIPDQGKARGVFYSRDADRIFVGAGVGGMCNTIDAEKLEPIRSVAMGGDADNVRYNPKTRRIYVAHDDREICVIEADSTSVSKRIAIPPEVGAFQLESKKPRMYVNSKTGYVIVIDTEKDEAIDRFSVAPAGVNAALAIDEEGRRLFVGCRENPALVVLNADTGRKVASVPIPGGVDDVSFDAERGLIVASCGEGAIALIRKIDSDRYESAATIKTAKGAKTSVYHAETKTLYLAVPRSADRPEQKNPEVWAYRLR